MDTSHNPYIVIMPTILFFRNPLYNGCSKTWVVVPIFDYAPLWKTMEQKGISQYKLLKCGVDNKTLDSLKKNKNITMITLEKLCKIIGCTPNDVVEIK